MKQFNINADVRVELTPYGIDMFNAFPFKCSHDIVISRGKTYFVGPLWQLMHIFGPVLYMGNVNIPFVENSIKISEIL